MFARKHCSKHCLTANGSRHLNIIMSWENSMIVRSHHRVLIQGITGKQGSFWGQAMLDYGTQIVGGVNPKRAGETHLGVPVFASVCDGVKALGDIDVSIMFIPPLLAKDATIDAMRGGVKLLICLSEHIPMQDVMEMHFIAKKHKVQIVGPNTAGLVTVGECFTGIMPAFNQRIFKKGKVGVISRSGSLGTLVCLELTKAGMGQSVFYGIGGDPMIGTSTKDALKILNEDDATEAIVICGEIGGNMEEQASEYISAKCTKPVIAFIAGKTSPAGKKMGHAGAIVADGKGDYASKRSALEDSGAIIADLP
ncbi:MAG: hypothetical protein AAF403_02480, partial [Pseudomonadota bacterium]